MFKIAICDDESFFTEELRELLSSYMMEKDVVFEIDTYSSGEALIELGIEVVRYNIVFLDINMEKVDGIKTAEMIRKVSREVFIVFVTAYVDYSLEGYRLDVVRYLLKGNANFQSKVNECMDAIFDKMNYSVVKREFDFKEGRKDISLERLLYIESKLHLLEFHIMEDTETVYTMYETLNVLDDMLSENGSTYLTWGIEGESYEVKNGEKQLMDGMDETVDFHGAKIQKINTYADPITVMLPQFGEISSYVLENEDEGYVNACKTWSEGDTSYKLSAACQLSVEQQEQVDSVTEGMKGYITKMRSRFIQGSSLTEFDSYVSQVKTMGADKYAEIWQEAYDAYKAR